MIEVGDMVRVVVNCFPESSDTGIVLPSPSMSNLIRVRFPCGDTVSYNRDELEKINPKRNKQILSHDD